MMKKVLIIFLIMFSFFSNANSNYDQLAHEFSFKSIDGNTINLKDYKEKVIVIVNVASRCGFTSQYEGLQEIWDEFKDKNVVVIGVPSNNFKQEPGSNREIKDFCDTKYNVSFRLFDKIDVNGENASPLFVKLTEKAGREIQWNFTKFLINKEGEFVRGFGTQKKPEEIEEHIKAII